MESSSTKKKKMSGYTLIEILIAVTIFTGIIILALAIFSQTINADNRNDAVRQRTEVARSAIDQITTDFQYLATSSQTLITTPVECQKPSSSIGSGIWGTSYCTQWSSDPQKQDTLFMMLKYPTDNFFTEKEYQVQPDSKSGYDLTEKIAQCTGEDVTTCSLPQNTTDFLISSTDGYVLATNGIFNPPTPVVSTGESLLYLTLPVETAGVSGGCSTDNDGLCYTLSTTLVPGGLR